MSLSLDALPDDPAALKAIIIAERGEALRLAASIRAYEALVQALRLRIARLQRQKFGPSSERIEREIDQLQLALEDLEVAMSATGPAPEPAAAEPPAEQAGLRRRGRPRIAAGTLRERIVLDPGERCPDCGGALRTVGEDTAELLEMITAKLKVIETVRLKKSCRRCEAIVQPTAPARPLPRGMAGPGLLAHILVAKYDDHVPLDRQGEILARHGVDVPRSTLIDWCGQAITVLEPLVARIKAAVMATDRLHADSLPSGPRSGTGGTRRCGCSIRRSRRWARPGRSRRAGSGSTCVTIALGAAPPLPGSPTTSRPTALRRLLAAFPSGVGSIVS